MAFNFLEHRKSESYVIPCTMHSKCRDSKDLGLHLSVRHCHFQGQKPDLLQTSHYPRVL